MLVDFIFALILKGNVFWPKLCTYTILNRYINSSQGEKGVEWEQADEMSDLKINFQLCWNLKFFFSILRLIKKFQFPIQKHLLVTMIQCAKFKGNKGSVQYLMAKKHSCLPFCWSHAFHNARLQNAYFSTSWCSNDHQRNTKTIDCLYEIKQLVRYRLKRILGAILKWIFWPTFWEAKMHFGRRFF